MYCKKCGNKLNAKDKFCTKCGNEVQVVGIKPVNTNGNSLAIAFGVIAICFFWIPIISIPFGIVAIVNGKSYKKCTNNNSSGVVLGIISIVLSVLYIIVIAIAIFGAFWAYEHVDKLDNRQDVEDRIDNFFDNDYDDNYDNNYDEDYFNMKGYSYRVNDRSMLYLNIDNSYVRYLDDNNHLDNYYKGNYSVYIGNDAINYISNSLGEYSITKEEQKNLLRSRDYDLEDYYLIILNCNKAYLDGKDSNDSLGENFYYGFYDDDRGYFDLTNIKTKTKVGLTLNNRISSVEGKNSL